jgi:hypothetical protein
VLCITAKIGFRQRAPAEGTGNGDAVGGINNQKSDIQF